jgi:endonuclease I/chitodextrinase
MTKKILSFYLLLFISIFSWSQESYYNDVNLNLTGIALKNALATKITATHTNKLKYTPDVWEASKITDANPNNTSQVILIYGWENGTDSNINNDKFRDNTLQDTGGGALFVWNREHVFSKSLANPSLTTDNPGPGTDAHNLRPADRGTNSSRGNKPFATGSGNAGAVGSGSWYPGDEWKGDVARMMMYMYVRYGNQCLPTAVGVGSSTSTPDDMIDLFLQWNKEDPVSDLEKKRNTYHENTSNTYAQGNRNPFIDNPYLATRIWGGDAAEDIWGIYTSSDTQAPTVPTNVSVSNFTTSSMDVSWTASTDNVGVTSYDVYVDNALTKNVTTTSASLSGLTPNTTYAITVTAKDLADNVSAKSTATNGKTLADTTAPTVPQNIVVSNQTDVSFKITWDASTDDTSVANYEVYIDNNLTATVTTTTYTASGLTASTTYSVEVLAKDTSDNKSAKSTPVNATTTSGSSSGNEIFFSEYFEGGGNNKAIELANATGSTLSLTGYSIKRQSNGAGAWDNKLDLSGNIASGDVYVIINGQSDNATLIAQADLVVPNTPPNFGAPINFNGNDPVGLFKNDVLIDIIGTFDGGSANFAKDKTLRRKASVSSPNTTFDLANEWDTYPKDTADNIGVFNTTLSVDSATELHFRMYPNPLNSDYLNIVNKNSVTINEFSIFTMTGKKVVSIKNPKNTINLNNLKAGLYIVKLTSEKGVYHEKLIRN